MQLCGSDVSGGGNSGEICDANATLKRRGVGVKSRDLCLNVRRDKCVFLHAGEYILLHVAMINSVGGIWEYSADDSICYHYADVIQQVGPYIEE